MEQPASPQRILIVDDEPLISGLLAERLSSEGFDCVTAAEGQIALDQLKNSSFHLVISDLRMPRMSGLELLKAAKAADPHLCFIMATGEDDVRVGIDAMKQGAADYLLKPFHPDAAVASVRRALEERRMGLELERYRDRLEEMVEQRTRQLEASMRRIEQTYDETLAALGAALELRDIETQGHSRRVTRYCLEIARALQCSAEQIAILARGSFLHDIGKIGIPDAILLKADRLTEEETAVMQTHARLGYDLVCRIAFLTGPAQIILTHQERYDGTGYPQGLHGEEIPLGSRIFAVADTLDAMTSDRPYRSALPFAAAREEIRRQSGLQFDPEIAHVFLSIAEEVWLQIRKEAATHARLGQSAAFGQGIGEHRRGWLLPGSALPGRPGAGKRGQM